MKKLLISLGILITFGVIAFFINQKLQTNEDVLPKISEASGTEKTYIIWQPTSATPWVHTESKNIRGGGVIFMDYDSARDFDRLEIEFNSMITRHKPDLLTYHQEWRDLQPLKNFNIPITQNSSLNEVVSDDLDFKYFDDFMKLANRYDIPVIFTTEYGGYGGPIYYPFTYAADAGWFWKRPDWQYGLADPLTDAMRHPPALKNHSDYNWNEHIAGYNKVQTTKHYALTTDNVEAGFAVYEHPELVYNGFDTIIAQTWGRIHSPIPSRSSMAYRDLVYSTASKIAIHGREVGVYGYGIQPEPTYAHLRENVVYFSGHGGGIVDDSRIYQVDYSPAELNKYNEWLANKGKGIVTEVPYPPTEDYKTFREYNNIEFLLGIKSAYKEADPGAKVLSSLHLGQYIDGHFNINIATKLLDPEMTLIGPTYQLSDYFDDESRFQEILSTFQANNPSLVEFMSFRNTSTSSPDKNIADHFNSINVVTYFPAVHYSSTAEPERGQPQWRSDGCADCTMRYSVPGKICDCDNLECGDSGCGGTCGTCSSGLICQNNKCVSSTTTTQTPTSISTSTGSPTPTITSTVTAIPTDTQQQNTCGNLDSNNDNDIDIMDFPTFAEVYGTECTDTPVTSTCGPKDSDANGEIGIIDFREFVVKYKQDGCY